VQFQAKSVEIPPVQKLLSLQVQNSQQYVKLVGFVGWNGLKIVNVSA